MDDVTYQTTTPATPPDATVIATDDVAGKHYQRVKLTDGTADGTAHAKVTTSQAGLSDGGLVTRPASVAPDVTASGTITASGAGQAVVLALLGRKSASLTLTGTFDASITVQGSGDGGSSWGQLPPTLITDAIDENLTDTPIQYAGLAGLSHLRAYAGGFTSGTVEVAWRATEASATDNPSVAYTFANPPSVATAIGVDATNGFEMLVGRDSAPVGSENGLVTRNIPSGTQAVEVAPATAVALSNVNDTNSSTTLLAVNADRRGVAIFNDSTEALYVKFGATASATSFTVKILAGGFYEMPTPIYVGIIDGIWAANASGAARITELT